MRIQELCSRVVPLKRRTLEEADGSFTEFWEEGSPVWAKIIPCMSREIFGEGWNNTNPVRSKYKVTVRFRHDSFARLKWETVILASLCPPLIDQRRCWMMYLMYEWGEV